MALEQFVFDPTKETPAGLQRKRALAASMTRSIGRPRTIGQGLTALGAGIAGYRANKQAGEIASAGSESAAASMGALLGDYGSETSDGEPVQLPLGGMDRDALHKAQLMQESGGDPNAVSSAGARGLMQVMPATAADPGFGMSPLTNIDDPVANEKFGRGYMDKMLTRYAGNQQKALAAYNWGAGNADKWDGNMNSLPAETRNYITKILSSSGQSPQQGGEQRVAQAMTQGPDFNQITKALNNPFLSKGQRSVATSMLKQLMGKRKLTEQRGYDAGLLNAANTREDSQLGIANTREDNQLAAANTREDMLRDEKRAFTAANPKPTTAQSNFEYGNENPGFFERQDASKKAGAIVINNTNGPAQSKGTIESDKAFGKDVVEWISGGAADSAKQIAQLKSALAELQSGSDSLTGPIVGLTPDTIKSFTESGRKSINTKEKVEEVVQRNLRLILGAQFTEKEGERLIARAYNPSLEEADNAARVSALIKQMELAMQSKTDASQYFRENGTLRGWQGKMPTIADFEGLNQGPDQSDDDALLEKYK